MHPSFGTYEGDRWLTVVASGPGMTDAHPNGSTFAYAEVYAVHPASGAWVQLTSFGKHTDGDPFMTAGTTQAVWAMGDAGVTFGAVVPEQAADGTWTHHKVVLHLNVSVADLGPGFTPVAWGDAARLKQLTFEPLPAGEVRLGAWSPTGALLLNVDGISRLDPDGTLTRGVVPDGRYLSCAPVGDAAAYMNLLGGYGYARVWLTDSQGANQREVTVDGDFARWKSQFSLDGLQLVAAAQRDVKTRAGWVTEYGLNRFTTQGGGYVDLVPAAAMSKTTPKVPIGWRN